MRKNAERSHVLIGCAIAGITLGVPLVSAACSQGPTRGSSIGNPDPGATTQDSGTGTTQSGGDTGGGGPQDSGAVPPESGASSGSSWAGSYSCSLSVNVKLTAPIPTSGAQTIPASMVVTENGATVAAAFTGDGGFMCSITFESNGSTASLSPATTQSCDFITMSQLGPVPTKITFSSGGTATRVGDSLQANNLAVTISDGPGGRFGLKGTGTMSADCMHD